MNKKSSPRFYHEKRTIQFGDYCNICDERLPKGTMPRSYVYLPKYDKLKLVTLCVLHDNSHRLVGDERPIIEICKISDCDGLIKTLGLCKRHYNKFYVQGVNMRKI